MWRTQLIKFHRNGQGVLMSLAESDSISSLAATHFGGAIWLMSQHRIVLSFL